MSQTMFDRYGGFATVRRIVSAFYDKVLDSPGLAAHFEHVEMRRLVDHQAKFISSLLGGPASFTDEHLRRVHARRGITTGEFRELVALLRETLEDFDFANEDIANVIDAVRRREGVIVARP
jgi:hemoglobin